MNNNLRFFEKVFYVCLNCNKNNFEQAKTSVEKYREMGYKIIVNMRDEKNKWVVGNELI
ncbi:hypothetical protein FACS1894152_6010 [Bacilli bacterium]|nr:hypothetical protein FACS1894152_6010 [Bacilli bacterium]